MRFQASFTRVVVAAGGTTLGTDAVPTAKPNSSGANTNQISGTLNNINGFPVQRFTLACSAPNGSAAIPITVYAYDEQTEIWYSCGSKSVTPGTIAYFDQPTFGQCGRFSSAGQSYHPGALDLCVVASAPVGAPDGTYTFAMGFDLSNSIGDSVSVSATVDSTTLAKTTQLPATLGTKAASASMSVVLASDQLPANAAMADGAANPTVTQISVFPSVFNGTTWDRLKSGIIAATSTVTGVLNSIPLVRYVAAPPDSTDGQFLPFQGDIKGNLRSAEQFMPSAENNVEGVIAYSPKPLSTSTYAPTNARAKAATSVLAKNAAGNLYFVTYFNGNGSTRYLQIHDASAAPADTTVPDLCFAVPTLTHVTVYFGDKGMYFTNGIYICNSTTGATKTLGSADGIFAAAVK